MNAIQKPLSCLTNVLQTLMEHFMGLSSRFTELHAKLDADTFLDFAILCRQNKA
jgi:hypothetical protein